MFNSTIESIVHSGISFPKDAQFHMAFYSNDLAFLFYKLQKKIQKNRKSKEEGRTSRKFITCEWTNTEEKQNYLWGGDL